MANQHAPAESGRRPLADVLEAAPTCHLCSWAFLLRAGKFWLKQINSNCEAHKLLPTDRDTPSTLAAWLGATA